MKFWRTKETVSVQILRFFAKRGKVHAATMTGLYEIYRRAGYQGTYNTFYIKMYQLLAEGYISVREVQGGIKEYRFTEKGRAALEKLKEGKE